MLTSLFEIESKLGKQRTSWRAMNCFISFYLYDKNKRNFALREATALVKLWKSKKYKVSLFEPSSFSGAIGGCQALPSSFLAYGVDANSDSIIDIKSLADNLGFIANYLAKHLGKGKVTQRAIERAIYAYNPGHAYVTYVLTLKSEIKKEKITLEFVNLVNDSLLSIPKLVTRPYLVTRE